MRGWHGLTRHDDHIDTHSSSVSVQGRLRRRRPALLGGGYFKERRCCISNLISLFYKQP